jgi:hypothetical protein
MIELVCVCQNQKISVAFVWRIKGETNSESWRGYNDECDEPFFDNKRSSLRNNVKAPNIGTRREKKREVSALQAHVKQFF